MIFTTADDVRKQMNEAGDRNQPFVFAVDYEMRRGFFTNEPFADRSFLWQINGASNATNEKPQRTKGFLTAHPISEREYAAKFAIAKSGLMRGDSFLLNLTVPTEVRTNLSFRDIFLLSKEKYKICVDDCFVCFSPETFVTIIDDEIACFPMKGTIAASEENAEEKLLSDYKETAEHRTIVDLIRNDLNQIAENVRVRRFRYFDTLHTSKGDILQNSSEVTGTLSDYKDKLGDILFRLLPAGSISGAPKDSTVKIIRQAEQLDRGFYTGVFGFYDGRNLHSAVAIRFIEKRDGKMFFRSGGGITVNSDEHSEYEEVIQKVYLPFT